MKNALLINVGDELLKGIIPNNNLVEISRFLITKGVFLSKNIVIQDNSEQLAEEISKNLEKFDFIIITGGLGPTHDDITREAVALSLGLNLKYDPELYKKLRPRFSKFGIPESEVMKKYANVIENAEILDNQRGIAPGQYILHGKTALILIPGPPGEAISVLENFFSRIPEERVHFVYLRTFGIKENEILEKCKEELLNVKSGLYPSIRGVDILLQSEEFETVKVTAERLKSKLGDLIYTDDLRNIEEIVGKKLRAKKLTLSVAESCTGGLLGNLITEVPGSSSYFMGGIIAYSNDSKIELLEVPAEVIEEKGAVSKECAFYLARNLAKLFNTSIAISITGIAGPTGGTKEKPVGLVYIGINFENKIYLFRKVFGGTRAEIKMKSALEALHLLNLILDGKTFPENLVQI